MPIPEFPPSRESELLEWSANWTTRIAATPTAFGLTAAQAGAYDILHRDFESAYTTANQPLTNSKANIIAKNVAKEALLDGLKQPVYSV